MRGLLSIFMLFAVILTVTCAFGPPRPKPRPNQPGFPFPGHGPFKPKPQPYPRFRRSPKGKVTIHGHKEGGKSSYGVDYEHKIFQNKHGSIGINGGVNKGPHRKPQSHVGVGGSFNFG